MQWFCSILNKHSGYNIGYSQYNSFDIYGKWITNSPFHNLTFQTTPPFLLVAIWYIQYLLNIIDCWSLTLLKTTKVISVSLVEVIDIAFYVTPM